MDQPTDTPSNGAGRELGEPEEPEARTGVAQLNIGRLRYPADDPRLAGFMDNLDRVNALAERSPGFLWRFTDAGGENATQAVYDPHDPQIIANLSLWESAEALETFVWKTVHRQFYGKKVDWFAPLPGPHFVMWPAARDARPTLAEAAARLAKLAAEGPSPEAFGWESLPHLQAWRARQCA